jgi:hypothetical protein
MDKNMNKLAMRCAAEIFIFLILLSISFMGGKDTFANTIPNNNVFSSLKIKTYENATLGISMQYPSNWNESSFDFHQNR